MKTHDSSHDKISHHRFTGLTLAVMVLIFIPLRSQAGSSEPESRGHPLSYWLEHCGVGTDPAERTTAEAAIREIGTNGLPAMLIWLRYDPTQTESDVTEFLTRMQKFAEGRWVASQLRYEHGTPPGYIGFNVLGPAAASAIPELAQIANDTRQPRPAVRALMALSAIGPAAVPAVEARLANTNFPFSADAAVRIYVRTQTSTDEHQLSNADARTILIELQTNANPLLAKGSTQLRHMMELPSSYEHGQTKSFSEALSDLRTERSAMGANLKPGWNVPAWAKLSPEEQLAASNTVHLAVTAPPSKPKDDEPYPYPLQPGTAAWDYATVQERLHSIEIPASWRQHATSWQLFQSAVGNPYFRVLYVPGYDIGHCYRASRSGTVSILQEVDTAPEFGTNVLRWLNELDLPKMAVSKCEKPYEPCPIDYVIVWYMASLDSALDTLDVASRQKLYRLAVWDADYFLSRSDSMMASGPLRIIYVLGRKPESFRGALPTLAILSPPPSSNSASLTVAQGFESASENVRKSVAVAKAALELGGRP